ncbi:MAG TPA: arabinan endo-1,5-alpha-L-arabinosidase [Dehalococcoidia bacterium]|nr:arabinan endo-1,5-alpha-L-arabinosidase [Dehalococcoidia bacterium]
MKARIGSNINGPSLIRAPDWLPDRLGKYYLYFAHHKGKFIRLAYADKLEGPWEIYAPGTLRVIEGEGVDHVASPDVHVDEENHRIRMYYHLGLTATPRQESRVAVSDDGINFNRLPETLGNPYFRVFRREDYWYALGMPGIFYRSRDGLGSFEKGPTLFSRNMRHSALKLNGNILSVFYSDVGDTPERILLATIELVPDWMDWRESEAITVLEPELEYEGVHLPVEPSVRDWAPQPVRQLRDPAIFCEDGSTCLLYSVSGEYGLAIARLIE